MATRLTVSRWESRMDDGIGPMALFRRSLRKRIKKLARVPESWSALGNRIVARFLGSIVLHSVRYRLGPSLYPSASAGTWAFHDEKWVRIASRWEHRRALQSGRSLNVIDNQQIPDPRYVQIDASSIRVEIPAYGRDRWVYLCLDPGEHYWRNYVWSMTVTRESEFRELQFAFRYIDFYNRYRLRHEAGFLWYDIVANGRFCNGIARARYDMKLGRSYEFELRILRSMVSCVVDGRIVFSAADWRDRFPRGSVAIILFEPDSTIPIRARIESIAIREAMLGEAQLCPARE